MLDAVRAEGSLMWRGFGQSPWQSGPVRQSGAEFVKDYQGINASIQALRRQQDMRGCSAMRTR